MLQNDLMYCIFYISFNVFCYIRDKLLINTCRLVYNVFFCSGRLLSGNYFGIFFLCFICSFVWVRFLVVEGRVLVGLDLGFILCLVFLYVLLRHTDGLRPFFLCMGIYEL